MAVLLNVAEMKSVEDAWPTSNSGLPASVQTAYDSWFGLAMPAIDAAVRQLHDDPGAEFTTPRGRGYNKPQKCRTLTIHRIAAAAGGPTPIPAELRSMIPGSSDDVSDKIRSMEQLLERQEATIASLVRQQAAVDSEKDVTANYGIHAKVLAAVPATFVDLDPLPKKERRSVMREHQGIYPEGKWPNKLVLKESTRNSKDMQKASKMTLPQFAKEASSMLEKNDFTTKMAGTTWSRIVDMQTDVRAELTSDPDAWYRADEILDTLEEMEACAEGTFRFGLDTSVAIRLNVANRVDVAMGINHLRVDPFKKETDDFISADTYKLVEAEAKAQQNLTWAKQGHFPGSRAGNNFFGKPSHKNPGGGKQSNYNNSGGGRGNKPKGGGKGKGRGRGKGKGKGRGARKDRSGDADGALD